MGETYVRSKIELGKEYNNLASHREISHASRL